MLKIILLLSTVFIAGCLPEPIPPQGYDQCTRAELFKSCLHSVPKGPERIHNANDWDEVVQSCGSIAAQQSVRFLTQIPTGCQAR